MTKEQERLLDLALDLLREMKKNEYCYDLTVMSINMLTVVPYGQKEVAAQKFTEIATQGLSEVDFHYEISQVFKEIMGYDTESM